MGFKGLADEGKKIAETTGETLEQTAEQKAMAEKLAALQKKLDKIAADNLKKSKALTKETAAQKELAKKKAELEAMFDMDRINLQAALSRKLSAEDELRVKILQKLRDGTKEAVDEAQRYADVLKVIEDGKITTGEIEELAKKWGMTTAAVLIYLKTLFDSNAELHKMLGLLDDINKKKKAETILTPPPIERFDYSDENILQKSGLASTNREYFEKQVFPAIEAGTATGSQLLDYAKAVQEAMGKNKAPVALAEGGIVTKPTQALIGEAGAEAVIPLDRMGAMTQKVVVNVAGSVISEGQLQSVIQDVLYNLNRTGAVTQLTNLGR
jgi:hypothetical protein